MFAENPKPPFYFLATVTSLASLLIWSVLI